jgi:hypothetical protein
LQVVNKAEVLLFDMSNPTKSLFALEPDAVLPVGPGTSASCNLCDDCRHLHCAVCEEGSLGKQYSDFWICHRCGELNARA